MSVVYLLVTTVSAAKTAEPIDMSFAVWTLGAQGTKYRSRWVYAAKETGGGGLTKNRRGYKKTGWRLITDSGLRWRLGAKRTEPVYMHGQTVLELAADR